MTKNFFTTVLLILVTQTASAQTDDPVSDARELYIAGDYAAALEVLMPQAEAGHPRAQNLVATSYQYGQGVPVDAAQAVRYFTLSADQGYPPAIYNLGWVYKDGMPGIAPDPAVARTYFTRSAGLDYSPSQSALGEMLMMGQGGPVDTVMALRLFIRGAALGDPASYAWMGYANASGTGMPVNMENARDFYEIASILGEESSANELGRLLQDGLGGPKDLQGAWDQYLRAVQGGSVDAAINGAWLRFDNRDVFPEQVQGLALCFWAVTHAPEDRAVEYDTACDEQAANFSDADRRLAEKIALGFDN